MRHLLAVFTALPIFALPRLAGQSPRWQPLVTIGSDEDDRLRLGQLLGRAMTAGYLLRSASTLTSTLSVGPGSPRWAFVAPELAAVRNSSIPLSLNDGAMWAGRGWNARVRAGFRAEWRRLLLTIAPELLASENLPFELPHPLVQRPKPPDRSPFSSPWHIRPYSIDLPLRFGDRSFVRIDPGQSTLSVDLGAVTTGLSTENEWWGPGIRNAIVLSDNAAGIPRLFFRTARPLRNRLGVFDVRWFAGGLSESRYFDTNRADDLRSISGLGFAFTPALEPDLTVGFTRAVYAPVSDWPRIAPRLFDVLRDFGRPNNVAPSDSSQLPGRDQIYSLFGRWVFPKSGFETYFEWARTEFPAGLRDLLTAPNHTQGYTLGLQWAQPLHRERDALRLQAEITYLEQNASYRDRPEGTYYTSRAVIQGYTQRGKVIGAAIGPGASSQWLALDYLAPIWRVGLFGGRIRWDDDALYLFPPNYEGNKWCSHDVSLFGGITAAGSGPWGRIQAALTRGQRFNVFFQHLTWCGPTAARNDIRDTHTTSFQVRFSPP